MTSKFKIGEKGQVTIFIIIAILIVVAIVIYFIIRGGLFKTEMPQELLPVYNYFLSCIEEETQRGVGIMGSQAGYLEPPVFEPGSSFAPTSSQLDFLSTGVPYWYYVSGNGIVKEQIPSEQEMEIQLEDYLEREILKCSSGFSVFEEQGFVISFVDSPDDIDVEVSINDENIEVNVKSDFSVSFGDVSASQNRHEVVVSSRFGEFYNAAKKIYQEEQKSMFLENYGVDVLRLYAPVDGVELSCSPKVWIQQKVKQELKDALEANVQAIKIKGDYYSLAKPGNKYFVRDVEISAGGRQIGQNGEQVSFLYLSDWPTKIEVYPESEPMMAEPIGLQQGLGILGFCYVPYHFVYDITYPVLVQIYSPGFDEIFQFPMVVVIDKNKARKALLGEAVQDAEPELCGQEKKVQAIDVYTYNQELDGVESEIDFECLGQRCDIGKTKFVAEAGGDALLSGMFPQCVNGYITAKAEGYADKRQVVSSNIESSVNIVLDRLYKLDLELQVDGKKTEDYAIINFVSEDKEYATTISWPQVQSVDLSEGQYEISVYAYKAGGITIPAVNKNYCTEVPKSGLLGVFGMTEEKCFDVNLPSQQLSNVISGGGKGVDYLTEDRLEKGKVIVKVDSLPVPKSLEELQDSYNLLEVKGAYLDFTEK